MINVVAGASNRRERCQRRESPNPPAKLTVIARERSDEAIQTEAVAALVWIASLPLAMPAKRYRHAAQTEARFDPRLPEAARRQQRLARQPA
jgi:hypothetical protein